MKDSVYRLVRAERNEVLSRNLGGMKVVGNLNDEVQKLRKVCEDRRFDIALKRHNAREEHIQAHTMLITAGALAVWASVWSPAGGLAN